MGMPEKSPFSHSMVRLRKVVTYSDPNAGLLFWNHPLITQICVFKGSCSVLSQQYVNCNISASHRDKELGPRMLQLNPSLSLEGFSLSQCNLGKKRVWWQTNRQQRDELTADISSGLSFSIDIKSRHILRVRYSTQLDKHLDICVPESWNDLHRARF